MSRTNTVLLNNFLDLYKTPIPFIPQTKTIQLLLSIAPPVPIPSTGTAIAGFTGPIGPAGKNGDRFSSITKTPVTIAPIIGGVIMLEVGPNLAYIYGTPVYVSSAETYTNNFKGTVFGYDSSTGFITIGNITAINGSFVATHIYTINAQVLTNVGPRGPQAGAGFSGLMGGKGPTGPTGPQVPFSGGSSAFIDMSMFQYGFDCGDVE